jgi:hypothetical protein
MEILTTRGQRTSCELSRRVLKLHKAVVDLDERRTEEDDEVLCLHDYALRKMKRRMRRLKMESFVSLKVSVCCLCMYQHSH